MDFKLGIISDEVSQDLTQALDLAASYRLDAVELRSVEDKLVHEYSVDGLRKIRARVQARDMEICALSTPVFKCSLDNASEVEEHRRILQKALEAADVLGVDILRAFTFWKQGCFEDALPKIVEEFGKIEPVVRRAGKTLVVEPDPSVYASNAGLLRQVLEQIDSPHVQALYDPGNHLFDPQGEEPYPYAYEHLHPYIRHIHLKDALKKDGDITAVALGDGEVGYEKLLPRLNQDGFNGYLVVETHYRLNREMDEEELKRPQGSGFSAGGWEASEQCLERFRALLERLGMG